MKRVRSDQACRELPCSRFCNVGARVCVCVGASACACVRVRARTQFHVTMKYNYQTYRRQILGSPAAGWMNANQEKGGNDK